MRNIFLISDTHFGHVGVTKFLREDGTKLRPWDSVEEMDEAMIQKWNDVVKPQDTVYHLGDVVINRRALKTLYRLNGDKVLIKGNHDIFRLNEYTEYFRDIRAYHVMSGMILSHIPVHESQLERFGVNVHGHLHSNRVMKDNGYRGKIIDPRYHSVCVEMIDYTPISLEDLKKRILEEGGSIEMRTRGNM